MRTRLYALTRGLRHADRFGTSLGGCRLVRDHDFDQMDRRYHFHFLSNDKEGLSSLDSMHGWHA